MFLSAKQHKSSVQRALIDSLLARCELALDSPEKAVRDAHKDIAAGLATVITSRNRKVAKAKLSELQNLYCPPLSVVGECVTTANQHYARRYNLVIRNATRTLAFIQALED